MKQVKLGPESGGGIAVLRRRRSYGYNPAARGNSKVRLIAGLVIAAFSLISYLGSKEFNPVTGESQYISMTAHQEVALGLRAAPQMMRQYGGLHPDRRLQDHVDRVGNALVQNTKVRETPYRFEFHLLRDPRTVNAFALPGGQIFITAALFSRLQTEGQLAGVLGHEIGHVVARHSAQQMAKARLTQGLTGAVVVAASDPNQRSAQMAAMIGQMINMKYGREDELESDRLGVRFMPKAGYDPRALIGVMEILAKASGGSRQPEFMSTHPSSENRIQQIQEAIRELFPQGVPGNLRS